MESISSLAAIVQVLSNAATAAIKVARFINDVKHAPEAHDDLQNRLGSMRRSLGHLYTAIHDREARLGSGGHQHHFKQEEQDILQEAMDINADCERCARRLEEFSKNQNGSLMQRVKGQIVQGIKRPEIQRLESRIQTNEGTMQLLLLFLKIFVHDDQSERERLLSSIRQQTGELKLLQDTFADTLKKFVSQSEHIEDIEAPLRQTDSPLSMITDDGGHDLMRTTNRTIETAGTLVDKLSRIGSEPPSQGSLSSESHEYDGTIPIIIEIDDLGLNSPVQWTPTTSTDNLTLELMTSFLDEYIGQAREDLANEDLDECEKNISSAIKCGEDRFRQHGQVFEQWFELQLLLAEVYQRQRKPNDAQNLIMGLMQSAMENGPEYSKITSVRRAQLYYARANFCLEGYYKCHDITLSDLQNIAMEAYIFVEKLKKQNDIENYPGDTLSQLLTNCAQIWSQVTEMQGDKSKTKVIRGLHPQLSGSPSRPHSFSTPPSIDNSGRRQSCNSSNLDRRDTLCSTPPGPTFTPTALSETAPTEASSEHTESSGAAVGRRHDSTPKLPSIGDVEETNPAGLTPLLIAAKKGDREMIEGLIKRRSANVNARDYDRMTALHHILRGVTCDEATIKLLLSHGIDVNAADSNGDTALHYSVYFQHRNAARIILKDGKADLEATNEKGQTAAILAASRSGAMDISMLQLLISSGANLDTATLPREMRSVVASLKARGGAPGRRESKSSIGQRSSDSVRPSNASQLSGRSSRRWPSLSSH